MITKINDTRDDKLAIWFSRILRWSLGLVFIVMGCNHGKDESDWAIIIFGLIIFVTGFFRPKCCINDNCVSKTIHNTNN